MFLDINVVMEFFGHRLLYADVRKIFEAAFQGGIEVGISTGSLYTISYLLGVEMKRKGVHESLKTENTRSILLDLLQGVTTWELSHEGIADVFNDDTFADLEDAFQYCCAAENRCDVLVTINTKHFKGEHKKELPVLSPAEFVEKFIEVENG